MPSGADQSDRDFVLARTKLQVPLPRSRMVSRPRLLEALDEGRSARLTLVCAPTGWGKTSLLAEWAAGQDGPVAWVSLDPGDDEPLRFWRYVAGALSAVKPSLPATAQRRLGSPVVSIGDEVLPVLINDLADLREPLVLVLDDYQLIADPEINEDLGYLLDRLPQGIQVVIATHVDPPLRLGRLRAMGDLTEVRGEQLRFTDQEAAALLNQMHGLDLGPDEVAAVQNRIEGWVAGLNLAALSLKRGSDRDRVLDALPADDRFVVDYLWNEVVLSQPRPVRHFMMRTAILERLTGGLCDAVSERVDGDEMLRELERADLFVVPLDRDRSWFRYHHLFRGLLLAQLERLAPDLIPDLHRRASSWYAAHGFMVEAIEHAITAGDVHYAADELERNWLEFYSAGQASTLLGWIDRLPPDAITAHPALALARAGVGRAVGQLDEVEQWLERAEQAAAGGEARGFASSVAGGAALARSMYRLALGDVPGAITWARRAGELERDSGSPKTPVAGYFLGVALFYDDPDEALPLLHEFLELVPDGEQDVRRYYAMSLLAEVHAVRGELELAEQLAEAAHEVTRRQALEEHPPTEQVHIALGVIALERLELDSAEEHFERAVALARRGGDALELAHALLWLARVHARQNDAGGGRDEFEAARRLVPDLGRSSLRALARAVEVELESVEQKPSPSPIREGDELSEAELRVLRLMPADLTYREMAQHLYVSLNTVRSHALRLRRKLGVTTRVGAVARARERGLL